MLKTFAFNWPNSEVVNKALSSPVTDTAVTAGYICHFIEMIYGTTYAGDIDVATGYKPLRVIAQMTTKYTFNVATGLYDAVVRIPLPKLSGSELDYRNTYDFFVSGLTCTLYFGKTYFVFLSSKAFIDWCQENKHIDLAKDLPDEDLVKLFITTHKAIQIVSNIENVDAMYIMKKISQYSIDEMSDEEARTEKAINQASSLTEENGIDKQKSKDTDESDRIDLNDEYSANDAADDDEEKSVDDLEIANDEDFIYTHSTLYKDALLENESKPIIIQNIQEVDHGLLKKFLDTTDPWWTTVATDEMQQVLKNSEIALENLNQLGDLTQRTVNLTVTSYSKCLNMYKTQNPTLVIRKKNWALNLELVDNEKKMFEDLYKQLVDAFELDEDQCDYLTLLRFTKTVSLDSIYNVITAMMQRTEWQGLTMVQAFRRFLNHWENACACMSLQKDENGDTSSVKIELKDVSDDDDPYIYHGDFSLEKPLVKISEFLKRLTDWAKRIFIARKKFFDFVDNHPIYKFPNPEGNEQYVDCESNYFIYNSYNYIDKNTATLKWKQIEDFTSNTKLHMGQMPLAIAEEQFGTNGSTNGALLVQNRNNLLAEYENRSRIYIEADLQQTRMNIGRIKGLATDEALSNYVQKIKDEISNTNSWSVESQDDSRALPSKYSNTESVIEFDLKKISFDKAGVITALSIPEIFKRIGGQINMSDRQLTLLLKKISLGKLINDGDFTKLGTFLPLQVNTANFHHHLKQLLHDSNKYLENVQDEAVKKIFRMPLEVSKFIAVPTSFYGMQYYRKINDLVKSIVIQLEPFVTIRVYLKDNCNCTDDKEQLKIIYEWFSKKEDMVNLTKNLRVVKRSNSFFFSR